MHIGVVEHIKGCINFMLDVRKESKVVCRHPRHGVYAMGSGLHGAILESGW